jgi:WD40 repeat protein
VAFSPDGRTLAVGERDSHLVTLFDVATGEKRISLSGHTDGIHAVEFSPDGKVLASSSSDLTVRLWDVHSGALLHTLRGHRAWRWPIAFSPDGMLLASGGMDNTVTLWNAKTGQPIGEPLIGHSNTVWSLAFSPSGRELASASADGSVRLWNVSIDPTANLLTGHTDSVSSLAVSENGLLATASRDGTVRRWNLETREPIGEPLVGHKQSAHHLIGVALSPDGALVALAAPNGIKLWRTRTGSLCYHLDQPPARCVAFSPDGLVLAVGSDAGDNTITLRDAKTGDIRSVLRGHRGTVRALAFSSDGLWLASSGMDPRIILWNIETGEARGEPLLGHHESVRSLAFSPDGTILASAGDATARLWNVETAIPLAVFEGHANWVFSVAFTPDGKTLASSSTDGTVKLWDVELHEQRATFASARGAGVLSVAFSSDGKTLVAGGDNGTLKFWGAKDLGRKH